MTEPKKVPAWAMYALLTASGTGVGGGAASYLSAPGEKLAALQTELDKQGETLGAIQQSLALQTEQVKAFWGRTWPDIQNRFADHEERLRALESRAPRSRSRRPSGG